MSLVGQPVTVQPSVAVTTFLQPPVRLAPVLVHQMWLDNSEMDNPGPPQHYEQFCETWQRDPRIVYRFWNRRRIYFLFQDYPQVAKYTEFYMHTIKTGIERCDFARYMVLALFGGIYADLKIECYGDILANIMPDSIHVLFNNVNFNGHWAYKMLQPNLETVNNAFIMSPSSKRHSQFWFRWLDHIVANYSDRKCVHETTGPHTFTKFIRGYTDENVSVVYVASEKVGPFQYRFLQSCHHHVNPGFSSGWYWKWPQSWKLIKWAVSEFRDVQLVLLLLPFLVTLFYVRF